MELLNKPKTLVTFIADRPGHDWRYALNTTKITQEMGWKSAYPFEEALTIAADWYLRNESWWRRIKSGEYTKYYERMYLER